MQITFYGAAQEVTGSMHLIEVNNQRILLECGLYQGHRADTYERNLNFPFDPAGIDHRRIEPRAHRPFGQFAQSGEARLRGEYLVYRGARATCARTC